MAELIFNRKFEKLKVAYTASRWHRFLLWWGGEIWAMMPTRLREWFVERREAVLVALTPEEIILKKEGQAEQVFPRAQDPEMLKDGLRRGMESTRPVTVVFCPPAAAVLRRKLKLPFAAAENLRRVLTFEMDRQTPFRPEQVYCDFRVIDRNSATKQLNIEMAIVPRQAVDADLAALALLDVRLDAMDFLVPAGERAGFNLLPGDRRAPRSRFWVKLNLSLLAAALVLLAMAMNASVENRQAALEKTQAEVAILQQKAKTVADRQQELKQKIEGVNFLAQKKSSRPLLSDVLLELTKLLGNDASLQWISLREEQLQFRGLAKDATALVPLLAKSALWENPSLQGSQITPDPGSGKEQFTIQAMLKRIEPQQVASDKAKEAKNAVVAPR